MMNDDLARPKFVFLLVHANYIISQVAYIKSIPSILKEMSWIAKLQPSIAIAPFYKMPSFHDIYMYHHCFPSPPIGHHFSSIHITDLSSPGSHRASEVRKTQ